MRRSRRAVFALWLALLGASSGGWCAAPEAGVSKALAESRAARLSDLHYSLEFELTPHGSTIAGEETVLFADSGEGDVAIDYRDGTISAASLNGRGIATTLENGHLILPGTGLVKGRNELKISFLSNVAAAGKAFTRYEDRDDGSEYIYSLFVPMDASMAFPCFDQPDLKASFTLQVAAPAGWKVIANTAASATERKGDASVTSFAATQPISTYLFAFAAGPFEAIQGKAPGEPAVYVRRSQLVRAQAEAPQVQQIAVRGIRYFAEYFSQPFPFSKYDLVLIPGFPFGGMEHAGATFLNEDSVLFRTAPTESDYFRRNILVLHETCHQWFGDQVTMRWFDDLWLKEGFAQYMAYKTLAQLEPSQLPWKHFYEEIKPLAYAIDETQGTTPVYQNIPNLKDAKSAYGAIVYEKAPAVLKQLNYFLGEENFRDGLRIYLKQHAYANAQWSDLIGAFEAARRPGESRDVKAWAKAWILQRGMPQVSADYTCSSGRVTSLTLKQKDVLGEGALWPISNEVVLVAQDEREGSTQTKRTHTQTIQVRWDTSEFAVAEARGKACPDLVFANDGDYSYGRFLLDNASVAMAARMLDPGESSKEKPGAIDSVSEKTNPLRRSMLWGALWERVHIAEASPRGYLDLVLKTLPSETDESLARVEGGHAGTALHYYLSDEAKVAYAARVETVAADRMLHAPTLGLRIVNFRTFTSVAETTPALGQMKSILNGSLAIPGMPLKPLDRWTLIGHLIALNDADAPALFAAEKSKDQSGEGQKYAYAVEAATPSAAVKTRYFEEYLHAADRQEDWLTQSLRPFNSWNQSRLTGPYLRRALDALPEIKQYRRIFFLGAWLDAFIGGQSSVESQAIVHDWLTHAAIDPDLRLKVLEAVDELDRTVAIRQKYPE